jgi:hypothetical protein
MTADPFLASGGAAIRGLGTGTRMWRAIGESD